MKNLFKYQRIGLFIILTALLFGCIKPYNPAKWSAVVIFNDTNESLSYQLKLSGKLTPSVEIKSGLFDYVVEYDQVKGDDAIDSQLTEVILLLSNCRIKLVREDILEHFVKDAEERNTWDLHVSEALVKRFAC